MHQVHDWSGSMAKKNQPFYPLQQQIQQLLIDIKNSKEKDQQTKFEAEVASLEFCVQQIKDESVKIKQKMWDIRPSINTHVNTLWELSDEMEKQWASLLSNRLA